MLLEVMAAGADAAAAVVRVMRRLVMVGRRVVATSGLMFGGVLTSFGEGGEGESNGVVDPGLKERYGYGSVWCSSSSEQGSAGIFLCRYGPLCNVGV